MSQKIGSGVYTKQWPKMLDHYNYKWRDVFLSEGAKVFGSNKANHKEQQMTKRIKRMQEVIGELTLELKKND